MTQKRNRNSTQSTKSNGSAAAIEKKLASKKRMREEDSEDESEKVESEKQRIKKIKQMLVDEGDSSSDGTEEVEESDDEDEDVSDDEEDEEDSEHDGDTEDEFPEKVIPQKEAKANKKEEQQSPTKAVADEKKSVEKKIQIMGGVPEKFKPSQFNIMLFNIPRLFEPELKGFLSKRNVHPESISCISSPVALLGFSSETAAKKAMAICSGANYDQAILAAVSASGEDLGLIKSSRNPHPNKGDAPMTCLFVTDLPKWVSEQELIGAIGIDPAHLRLITSGPKNRLTNACYIDCKSEIDAQKAFHALSTHQFNGKNVKVYLKPQSNFYPVTEDSVVVANVPFSADIDTIKKEFPEAKKVELTRRGCFMLFFENSVVRDRVVKNAQGKTMEGRELRFITADKAQDDVAVFVSNVAFTATIDDLKAAFPRCKNVFMKKNNNGKFSGNAIVYFNSKEEAESATKSAANKEINGKPLKVKISYKESEAVSETRKREAKSNVPKTAENKKIKAVEPVQVGSESEEDEDSEEDGGEDDVETAEGSSDEGDEDEEQADSNDDDVESEEHRPSERKRPKIDKNKSFDSRPPFKQGGGRGSGDFRGGNRGGGSRGGNRGGGFRGGNRGGGSFRGGNQSRGREFRGGRGRGVSKN